MSGAFTVVKITSVSQGLATASNFAPNLPSFSRIRNRGPWQCAVASLSDCATQASLGDLVTLKWITLRPSCSMMKNAKMGLKKTPKTWTKSQGPALHRS
jgi:hypothetical protein